MKHSVEKIVDDITQLNLAEVASLIKDLKERLNLPDAPVFAGAQHATTAPPAEAAQAAPEKSKFELMLKSAGGEGKTQVIKAVKDIKKKLGKDMALKELKELVESAPVVIASDLNKEEAELYLKALKDCGADCELK